MKKLLEEKSSIPEEGSTSLVPLDPLSAYLAEIKKYKPLSMEEERDIAIRYRETGDVEAAYVLVTSNLQNVVNIAMTFRREFQNLLDLIQEGNIGLMQAVKKFDPFKGIRLPAYASWWIKAYILKYILDNWRLVKVGTTNMRRKLLYNLQREKQRLEEAGFYPTTKLLADKFGTSEADIVDVEMSIGASDISLEAPIGEGGRAYTVADTMPSGEDLIEDSSSMNQIRKLVKAQVDNIKKKLNDREIDILEKRIMADTPATLQEIGDKFGITREAVRQIEKKLLKQVRNLIQKEVPDAVDWESR
ncbi:MAG: RNA polymerase factor sigma-32 [Nitrospinae bacterium]|nr:RNA polymerase factor sigma-32 [Nitrospinota bacterium]